MAEAPLSDVATIGRIAAIEGEIARIRVEAYGQAGIALPAQCGSMALVISIACRTFFMSELELKGESRLQRFCHARFAVMWVARTAFDISLTVIGRGLGGRDHSTVISGIKRAEQLRGTDPAFREVTDQLLAIVSPKSDQSEEAEDAPSRH